MQHDCMQKFLWMFYQKEEIRTHVFYAPSSHGVVFIKWNTDLEAKHVCIAAYHVMEWQSYYPPWLSKSPS